MTYDKKKNKFNFLKVIALLALIIPVTFTIIASTLGRKEFKLPHQLTLEALGTVQSGLSTSVSFCRNIWNHYIDIVAVSKKNEALLLKIEELRAKNTEYREAAATNVRLKKLLDLEKSLKPPTVTARIVGRDPAMWFKTITIDKGSSSGIKKGMPAITVEGVVGQVANISPNFAKVLLAIDPSSAIYAFVQKNRVPGIIKGKGSGYQLDYVLKSYEVANGDHIVTSGMGGIFLKGTTIGTVSKVINDRRGMFQKIEVTPAVNFRKLEYVTIVLKKDPLTE